MKPSTLTLAATLLATNVLPAQDGSPFKVGFPTSEAAQKAVDNADYQRAVVAYRFWYPTVSVEGIFHGNREQGINDNEAMPILSAGPRHVGFTLNSDTPYGGGVIDLEDETSLDLYFGPKAPTGKEGQWIQTTPGRGWFAYFRIYGPKGPAFDGTWKPGDIEEVK